jgi:MFS family permease
MADLAAGAERARAAPGEATVILACSLGTMFEWYDFFLYGSLASLIASHFFSAVNETTAFILALAAFAAGFLVRPLGALFFGRIGDLLGRKNTFLVTMAVMGLSTFAVGWLPGYAQIGLAAPFTLIGLRLLQGLAIGGEYGGAATYVAEHAPHDKRALNTSWINLTATLGLLLSLVVIMSTRVLLPKAAFEEWGWRIPFIVSAALLAISLWIRLRLSESPVFQRMKEERATSEAPLAEAFGQWRNLKLVLIVLLGACAGSSVIWYAGQFYTLFFLERLLKVDGLTADSLMALGIAIGAPSFVLFGWLSDRIGRKTVLMAGFALAVVTYLPVFRAFTAAANPALARAQAAAPVAVYADPGACSLQFDPIGRNAFDSQSCDIAKAYLTRAGVSYQNHALPRGAAAEIRIGAQVIKPPDPRRVHGPARVIAIEDFQKETRAALDRAGYPAAADTAAVDRWIVIALVAYLVALAAMTYAPLAATLVELFPARIRYTSLSLPYHIGAGWFGGFLPTSAFAIVAATGDIYSGLWYPLAIAAFTLAFGLLLLPETRGRPIEAG